MRFVGISKAALVLEILGKRRFPCFFQILEAICILRFYEGICDGTFVIPPALQTVEKPAHNFIFIKPNWFS